MERLITAQKSSILFKKNITDQPWGIACYDYDADGLTNDVDPCPLNANLAWGDEDANGRDDACDWPDLIFASSKAGYNQPWLWRMNPEAPLVSQLAETFAGSNRFTVSAQAEVFFEFAERYIYLYQDNGEHILVNSNAQLIGALGEGVVIQELSTGITASLRIALIVLQSQL